MTKLRPNCLNPEVQKELNESGSELYVAWCLSNGTYDWEIQPLFNDDWVKTQQKAEMKLLTSLKIKVAEIIKNRYAERE